MEPHPVIDAILPYLKDSSHALVSRLLESEADTTALENILQLVAPVSIPRVSLTEERLNYQKSTRETILVTLQAIPGAQDDASGTSSLAGKKRDLDEAEIASNGFSGANKKTKLDFSDSIDVDDTPIFTLHAVSFTSPIRKKADVTVHRASIRLTAPTTAASALDAAASTLLHPPLPISAYKLAFLLNTPNKPKGHHTVVILPNTHSSASDDSAAPQIIFGLDANPTVPTSSTHHASTTNSARETHPKGTPSKPLIHSLFAFFPQNPTTQSPIVDLLEPSPSDFKSAHGLGQAVAAYIGAKEGNLYFLNNGLLFGEKKPCVWHGIDTITAMDLRGLTGRTFTLVVSILPKGDALGVDQASEEIEETHFTLIDAKEVDPVRTWIAKRRGQFASPSLSTTDASTSAPEGPNTATSKNTPAPAINVPLSAAVLDSDDEEDEDFKASDSDDSGSNSGRSSSSDDEETNGDGEEPEGEESANGDEGSDDEVEELDASAVAQLPSRLRAPGAVPKMSKAAMDMAIDMLDEEFT